MAARSAGWIAAVVIAVVAGGGCRSKGIVHVVQPGENLYRIGRAYGVPYEKLARANRLRDPSRIYPGQKLFIPGARKRARVRTARKKARTPVPVQARAPVREERSGGPRFDWPLARGTITSGFGPRGDSFHDGIDIAAPMGAPVRAAADGEVAFAGTLPGYGNLVILRHAGGYATVYAHNDRNHVRKGQRVRRGQLIAALGRTGRTDGPNLHFEIRRRNVAVDPLRLLPANARVSFAEGSGGKDG